MPYAVAMPGSIRRRRDERVAFRILAEGEEQVAPELRAISFRPLPDTGLESLATPAVPEHLPHAGPRRDEDPAELVWRAQRGRDTARAPTADTAVLEGTPRSVVVVAMAMAGLALAITKWLTPEALPGSRPVPSVAGPHGTPAVHPRSRGPRERRRSTARERRARRTGHARGDARRGPRSRPHRAVRPAVVPTATPLPLVPTREPGRSATPALPSGLRPMSANPAPAEVEFGFEHTGVTR